MAAWYEPWAQGGAARADCVAQIISDLNAYLSTDPDGRTTLNVAQFMILAGTRLAAIPEPSDPFIYAAPELLRGTNVRPMVDKLAADLAAAAAAAVGTVDLSSYLLDLQAKSAAVTKYFDAARTQEVADLLLESLSAGPFDKNMPQPDDDTPETRYYRTTFVTDWEEESAPSEVSAALDVGPKDSVVVTIGTVPTGRNISYWRAYRSNSGNESAAFQYTPYASNDLGVPAATATLTDDIPNSELQEVCPSTIWDAPAATLGGIVPMANGIHLGFFGNTLCPSESYKPYAFPEDYRITVGHAIVGLCAWEQSAFVLTRGIPYFVSGTDAASLTAKELPDEQPCVSARSICKSKAGVVYASPDGLCLATPTGVQILTAGHFTREEWQALSPEDMIVQEHDGVIYIVPDAITAPLSVTTAPADTSYNAASIGADDIVQFAIRPRTIDYPNEGSAWKKIEGETVTSLGAQTTLNATYSSNYGISACQSNTPRAVRGRAILTANQPYQIVGIDLLTNTQTVLLQTAGTGIPTDVPFSGFASAYDDVTAQYAVIDTAGAVFGSDRDTRITVLPGTGSIKTPVLPTYPVRMAFYNNIIYAPATTVVDPSTAGTVKLRKYSGADGSYIGEVSSGLSLSPSNLLVCANADGVFVVENNSAAVTMQRRVWKVTDVWTLVASDITYDNTAGVSARQTTFYCDSRKLVAGPSVSSGGVVTYTTHYFPSTLPIYALDSSSKLVTLESGSSSAVYRDAITDTLVSATGTTAEALFTAATRLEATWTRRIVLPAHANLGWLEVEADYLDADGSTARSVVVTISKPSGTVLATKTVTSDAPVRLPAFREKEIVVSIVSKAKVTRVRMASTAKELKEVT
jgi:hypothetical protein